MAGGEIVSCFLGGKRQIGHHRKIGDCRPLSGDERAALQSLSKDCEEIIKAPAEMAEHVDIGFRRERAVIPVGRHVSGELMVVPEQPAKNFEFLFAVLTSKPAVTIGE